MANPSDWFQFYRRNLTGEELQQSQASSEMYGRVSDATVVTSAATGNPTHLNAEGRVSKPSRRRSRASRRAPTTLLNTDTTNFRAMVQQFTGVPSAPFTTGSQTDATSNFNFGLGSGQQHLSRATIMAPSSGYHLQQQQFQQQQQQYMLSMNNTSDVYLQRFSNGNQRPNMEVSLSDGFLSDSIFHPRAS
ncbi:hypothetical protein NE237_000516 [Protea cynaroides]|uniref:VQ domain-containing protein n=1 Tax=Protea cynaroides TaxID=273540 RepID=A0A9Q0KRN2_9MAGN|nr:hypothetical protein NE237_000516 [Protea cynaroides]